MMNRCGYEQKAMDLGSVVCPKPRRLPLRCPNNPFQSEVGDFQARTELLDIILTKGKGSEMSYANQAASSPPYFCGSPPSRASNPLIQDEQFAAGKVSPATPPSPSARKGGYARMTFGHAPATVRIEGFDCLSRDRRNCSISAVA